MARSYLKVYFDFDEKTDELNDSEKGRLLLALYRYAMTGEKPVLTGNERFLFSIFKGEIDRDIAVYNVKVTNGNQGGRPPKGKTENNLTEPNETEEEPKITETLKKQETRNIKDISLTGDREKRKRFSPPTLDEVSAYCMERGNRIDPQYFVDYYEARGWELKPGQKVKDWKACVRTWEQRDQNPQKPKLLRAQMYEQREYNEEEMRKLLGVDDLFNDEVAG